MTTKLCDRCRAHPPELVLGSMCLCAPCAEQIAWSHGVQATAPAPASSPRAPAPAVMNGADPFVGFQIAHMASGDSALKRMNEGFPWVRVMAVLGGVAVVGVVGLWVYKITETVGETKRSAMRIVENHPEVLKAVL